MARLGSSPGILGPVRGVAIKLGLTGLMLVGLVALNLGVDFGWALPFGHDDLGDLGGDG